MVAFSISLVSPIAAKMESKEKTKFIKTIHVITALEDFVRFKQLVTFWSKSLKPITRQFF